MSGGPDFEWKVYTEPELPTYTVNEEVTCEVPKCRSAKTLRRVSYADKRIVLCETCLTAFEQGWNGVLEVLDQ